MTEDEMVGRHHQLDGHEFEQALRAGDDTSIRLQVKINKISSIAI